LFEALEHFAGAYFHQDWDLDSETPMDVVRLFRSGEPAEETAALIGEIELLLRTFDEPQIGKMWLDDWGGSYDPRDDGMSYHDWFGQVRAVLREPH